MIEDEIRRLDSGLLPDERPGGFGLVELTAKCEGNAEQVVERTREILALVLNEDTADWPTLEHWRKRLPDWFVEACGDELSRADAERFLESWHAMSDEEKAESAKSERWALANWLYWFLPANREWEFWSCESTHESSMRLLLKVDDLPIAVGALEWLLRASGAHEVVFEEDVER